MRILAIETSCDETAISIIEADEFKPGALIRVLSNVVLSQVAKHAEYGGVFPSLAVREHSKSLVPVLKKSLEEAGMLHLEPNAQNSPSTSLRIPRNSRDKFEILNSILEREQILREQFLAFVPGVRKPDIDAVAVTSGPGLEPTLWVGINFAKALATIWDLPIIPVNHMEGHLLSALLEKGVEKNFEFRISNLEFPALALLISGGHTELVLIHDWLKYEIVGQTKDDAVGEAFDKAARMMGLPYPGGPAISRLAKSYTPKAKSISLPRPMIDSGDFNFSFSGLKTAVLYRLKEFPEITEELRCEMSHEFEEAATEVLVKKTLAAAEHYGTKTILVGGGVSANDRIKEVLIEESAIQNPEVRVLYAPRELTGDNALMIAVAAWVRHSLTGEKAIQPLDSISANGNIRLS
ncbi:MAG: tRNA (adenosine(37)-N6)-threonylcarbamoyltransferase complex transferase subunit TsaD [Parcubacteria group bacterium]|nr:tRNA (adenosine(37)-N6)-threonylcarbamoyltransferase complex transferase subunit TsaD [Parcubacteria group bacterium]